MCRSIILQGFTEIGQIHQKIFSVVNYSDLFEGKSSTFRDSFLSYAKFVRNCKKVFKCFSAFQCTKNSIGALLIISRYQLLISHCSGDEYVFTLLLTKSEMLYLRHLAHKVEQTNFFRNLRTVIVGTLILLFCYSFPGINVLVSAILVHVFLK